MSAGKEHLDIQHFNIFFNFISLHSAVNCEIFSLFFQTQCYARNGSIWGISLVSNLGILSHHVQVILEANPMNRNGIIIGRYYF